MKFFKSTVVTFITNIIIFAISFFTTFLTARLLGANGNGTISISNTTVQFALIFLGFGITSSNVYFVGKDRDNLNTILGVNFFISFVGIIPLCILYFLNFKFKFGFFNGISNQLLLVILSIVPFANLKGLFINVLLGLQEIGTYNKINILDNVLTFALLIIFIVIMKTPLWIIVSNLIATIILLVVISYYLFVKKKYNVKFSGTTLKDMAKYGFKAQLATIVQSLNYRLDAFIVNSYLGLYQAGLYAVAVKLGETMWKLSGTIGTVVLPTTTNSKDKMGMKDFINKVTRFTFYIIIICAILLVFCSRFVMLLFGKQYLACTNTLILLLPGICVFSICNILSNYIAGIGMVEKNVIASSIACVVTVALDFTLIPTIGINGAAIASSLSYIVITIVTIFFYLRISNSKLSDILILKRSDLKEIKMAVNGLKNRFKIGSNEKVIK